MGWESEIVLPGSWIQNSSLHSENSWCMYLYVYVYIYITNWPEISQGTGWISIGLNTQSTGGWCPLGDLFRSVVHDVSTDVKSKDWVFCDLESIDWSKTLKGYYILDSQTMIDPCNWVLWCHLCKVVHWAMGWTHLPFSIRLFQVQTHSD